MLGDGGLATATDFGSYEFLNLKQGADIKTIIFLVFCTATLGAQAKDSRQEVMQACAQKARDKDLTGDAHADFMRGCLRPPADHKTLVFDKADSTKASDAKVLQPAMTQPGAAASMAK